ncbi:MAG: biliverdin-producing heme oxygenase [Rhodospirillales bacterium]
MSVVEELRRATKPLHEDLEDRLDIVGRLITATERRSVLCGFLAVYSVAEAALLPHLRTVPDLDFERRLKLPALRDDLRALGIEVAERRLDLNARFPALGGVDEALGFAYVLEGATLGGRVIRKRVAAAGASLVGLSFFDVYGPATADQWKRFCVVVERECASGVAKTVEGALAGFGFVRAALLD